MRVFGLPGTLYQVSGLPPAHLSARAKEHWRYLSCWQVLRKQGLSSTDASEAVGVARSTLYRWQRDLKEHGPWGLEARSRRPRRGRQSTWTPELANTVLQLREQYPRWGKDKLVVLLGRQGWQVSTSMVGRILTRLKARGVLKEPPRNGISARRRPRPRPYAVRKPREYQAKEPGDIVQIDTLDVRPLPKTVLKHFTARDVVSKWDVLEVHTRATSALAANFLVSLRQRLPFPIKAIQVDGGSEFQADFERACQELGLKLFVLPPRSPKLNGHVERAQRTHTEEFYELYDGDLEIAPLNQALLSWEQIYNTVRPHHSLDGRTPKEYLEQCHPELVPAQLSHM